MAEPRNPSLQPTPYRAVSPAMQSMSMEEKQKVLPAYTVTPLDRTTTVNVAVKDELGFRTVQKQVQVSGFMVKTLRGDSVFVTHDELVRMKLDRNLVPMVLEGGDDTTLAVQGNNPALTEQQRTALDVLTRLVSANPGLVEQLLATQGENVQDADVDTSEPDKEE